jgi:hypothetical protein
MGSATSVSAITHKNGSIVKSKSRNLSREFDPDMILKFEFLSEHCSCGVSNLLKENESARMAFYDFLFDDEVYKSLDDRGQKLIRSLRSLEQSSHSLNILRHTSQDDDINAGFILPNQMSKATLDTESTHEDINVDSENNSELSDQFVKLQLLSVFPYFIKSTQYRKWTEQCVSTDTSNALISSKDCCENDTRTQRIQIFSKREKKSKYSKLRSSIADAEKYFCKIEMNSLSATGIAWLDSVLSLVESIPVCFSMATARVDRPGFPLIYVNKAFERVTSYKRAEIIGQNCR